MMGGFPLEQWFYEMPVCTRWWMTAALSASVLVQCRIISPFQLFYSVRTVFFKSQVGALSCHEYLGFADQKAVLAASDDLLLLRPSQPRSALPHLLPPAVFAPPRGVVRSLTQPFLMAPHLRFHTPPLHSAHILHGLSRLCPKQHPHLHLEPEEPGHAA
jgi:hypothetical protein